MQPIIEEDAKQLIVPKLKLTRSPRLQGRSVLVETDARRQTISTQESWRNKSDSDAFVLEKNSSQEAEKRTMRRSMPIAITPDSVIEDTKLIQTRCKVQETITEVERKLRALYAYLIAKDPESAVFLSEDIRMCSQPFPTIISDLRRYADTTLRQALEYRVDCFLDNEGYPVSIKKVDELSRIKLSLSSTHRRETSVRIELLFPNEIKFEHSFKDLRYCKSKTIQEAKPNELICINFLQGLNSGEKAFSLRQFFVIFPEWVKTKNLFRVIASCLRWSEKYMPVLQKMRALHIVRLWKMSYRYAAEKKQDKIAEVLEEIYKSGSKNKNPQIVQTCYEIKMLKYDLSPIPKLIPEKPIALSNFFKELLEGVSITQDFLLERVSAIAQDMKLIAAEVISISSYEEFVSDKCEGTPAPYSIYYAHLIKLLDSIFCMEEEALLSDRFETQESLFQMKQALEFTLSLAHELIKIKDFYSSFIIYMRLNCSGYSPLFSAFKKKRHTLSLMKNSQVDAPALVSGPLEKTWKELATFFSIENAFGTLCTAMGKCKQSNEFYIPEISILKKRLMASKGKIEAGDKGDLSLMIWASDSLLEFETTMKLLIAHYNRSPSLTTDLKKLLVTGFLS